MTNRITEIKKLPTPINMLQVELVTFTERSNLKNPFTRSISSPPYFQGGVGVVIKKLQKNHSQPALYPLRSHDNEPEKIGIHLYRCFGTQHHKVNENIMQIQNDSKP